MRELLCDGVRALWHLVDTGLRNFKSEVRRQIDEAEARREVYASLHWNNVDEQQFHHYTEHQ